MADPQSKTLHVAPGDSAGGSLARAIRDAGRSDEVLRFLDDLSCGPIEPDDPSVRAAWWNRGDYDVIGRLTSFWDRVDRSTDRLVVWVGRHSAREHAFFLAWVDRLGPRPYDVMDVTGLIVPYTKTSGQASVTRPIQAVSLMQPSALQSLFGTERPLTAAERDQAVLRWRELKADNAPFRILTADGLTSAPEDVFDELILDQATAEWQKMARVIGNTMGYNYEPYIQVGDMMLHERVLALIESGRLRAEGDVDDMQSSRIRLPD